MRGNRKRDTVPERKLRSALHARGLRYRVNVRVPVANGYVRPDITFNRARLAVFVDGCFWHGCPQHGTAPRTNGTYWEAKLARNRERDVRDTFRLEDQGWTVVRVWEHEALDHAVPKVIGALRTKE